MIIFRSVMTIETLLIGNAFKYKFGGTLTKAKKIAKISLYLLPNSARRFFMALLTGKVFMPHIHRTMSIKGLITGQ